MAATRTGTITEIANTGASGSTSITAPSDATGIFVCVTGTFAAANQLGSNPPTWDGTTIPAQVTDADDTGAANSACIYYLATTAVGSKTFAWNWGATPTNGVIILVGFVKGSAPTSPIRSADGGLSGAATSATTSSLTAQADDLLIAFSGHFLSGGNSSENFAFGGTGVTKIAQTFTSGQAQGDTYNNIQGGFSSACGSIAEAAPTAAVTVSCTWSRTDGGTVAAIVIKPGPTTQKTYASADSADGAWTDQAGGTSLFAAIDETSPSDSDYIRSELTPVNSGCRVKLGALSTPQSGTRTLSWRIGKDATGGGTIDMKMQLRQGGGNTLGGGTLVQEFTRNGVDAATQYDETLTGTVTDYADLYLEFYANQT